MQTARSRSDHDDDCLFKGHEPWRSLSVTRSGKIGGYAIQKGPPTESAFLNCGARAAIWHLVEFDAGRLLEQHGSEMERVADAGMRDIDLARLPFGLVDQFGHGIDLELVRISDQHAEEACGERHWREILRRVEWELLVEAGIGDATSPSSMV